MHSATIHGQKYVSPTWNEIGEEVFELSKKIIKSGVEFDRVIALAKGGLSFSRTLVDYLNIPDLSSIQIEFYTGVGQTAKTPVITQSLPVSIRDERILIFDEVVESGKTLEVATQYLHYHGSRNVHTATLASKPWAKFPVDFTGFETDAWIIFPHEKREHIQLLQKMWQQKGDSPEKIYAQMLQIGIPKEEVEFFLTIE